MTGKVKLLQRGLLDTMVRHGAGPALDRRAEHLTSLFEKYLPAKSHVLDIGGGWGYYHQPLRRRGHFPTVVDVVKPGVQHSPVVIYDGKRLPFPDKSFDISLFVTVLHHIPDVQQAIREACRVTRGSVIVVEDLYHHALGRCWTVLRDQLYNIEFFGHPRNFHTKEGWRRIFGECGLEITAEDQVYTWLAGMRILNGIFVCKVPEASGETV